MIHATRGAPIVVVAAMAMAGCSTPRQAILGGAATLGAGAAMVLAASEMDDQWGEPSFRPIGYFVGLPIAVAGAIILGAGIAAAIKTE